MTRVAKVLMEHVELADQIGEDDRAVTRHYYIEL